MTENQFEFVKVDETASEHLSAPRYSYWKATLRQFFGKKTTIFMLIIAVTIIAIAMIQPLLSHYNPIEMPNILDGSKKFLPPSLEYLFGTDQNGNNLFDATWAGAQTSILIGFISTIIVMVLGIVVGAIWGFSKTVDKFMIEIYNVVSNIPYQLLVIILVYVIGRGFWPLVFALTVTTWISVAYSIRVQVMIIRDREYNLASQTLGTPLLRMITKNILPYLVSVIVTMVTNYIPSFISTEVFLSWLGIGLPEQVASLGRLISRYTPFITTYPHLFWIPVGVLALITISLYVLGQSLGDASDPRTHR